MAYPSPFVRVVAYGTLFGVEEWSCSLSFAVADDAGDVNVTPPASAEPYYNAWATFVQTTEARLSTGVQLLGVKANLIGTDGRYVSQGESTFWEPLTPVSGVGTPVHPPQVAVAVTLTTDISRGLASRGRFYLPCLAIAINTNDGRILPASIDALETRVGELLNTMNNLDDGLRLAVASGTREGRLMGVAGFNIGQVFDTQRRRRRSLPEEVRDPKTLGIGGGGPF